MHATFRLVLLFLATALIEGCNLENVLTDTSRTTIDSSEHPNAIWIGAHLSKLLEALGQPDNTIDVSLRDGVHAIAYVYGPIDADDTCINAFVVRSSDSIVTKYFCR